MNMEAWKKSFETGVKEAIRGNREAARDAFAQAVKLRPDHALSCAAYAEHAIATGRAAEASRLLGPIAEKSIDEDKIVMSYALCLLACRDAKRALAVLGLVAQ